MVDREARNSLLATIDDYLAGRIRSFEFDERLQAISTCDRTVKETAFILWCCYDDLIDHPVNLS